MSKVASLCALVLLGISLALPARANGRFPGTTGIHLGGEQESVLVIPTTFGLLLSTDGGATVGWVCENALGYQGTYDPSYAIGSDGSMWLTTFDGIRVSRDGGCVWNPVGAPFDVLFPGNITSDASGRLWVVTAQAGASNGVYRNDTPTTGESFTRLNLDSVDTLFTSVRVAPSAPTRAYVGGFAIPSGGGSPEAKLFVTDDGGASWDPLPTTDFVLSSQPQLFIEAVSPTDPDLLFVRVPRTLGKGGDALYRSANGGASFQEVFTAGGPILGVVVRANGSVVVGSGANGINVSSDGGLTFSPSATPNLACVTESSKGVLYGCGNNWIPDYFAIGTSTDAATWAPLFRFTDIKGPVSCSQGTTQRDVCENELWQGLAMQLGIGVNAVDAGPDTSDAGTEARPPSDGCGCRSGGPMGSAILVVLAALGGLSVFRRRRSVR